MDTIDVKDDFIIGVKDVCVVDTIDVKDDCIIGVKDVRLVE